MNFVYSASVWGGCRFVIHFPWVRVRLLRGYGVCAPISSFGHMVVIGVHGQGVRTYPCVLHFQGGQHCCLFVTCLYDLGDGIFNRDGFGVYTGITNNRIMVRKDQYMLMERK